MQAHQQSPRAAPGPPSWLPRHTFRAERSASIQRPTFCADEPRAFQRYAGSPIVRELRPLYRAGRSSMCSRGNSAIAFRGRQRCHRRRLVDCDWPTAYSSQAISCGVLREHREPACSAGEQRAHQHPCRLTKVARAERSASIHTAYSAGSNVPGGVMRASSWSVLSPPSNIAKHTSYERARSCSFQTAHVRTELPGQPEMGVA